jgi:hypothetical protein
LSTAYHPQTYSQTEDADVVIEQYLCCFINYLQDDWDTQLPLAKCACHDAMSAATKATPFHTNIRLHPCLVTKPPRPTPIVPRDQAQYKSADELAQRPSKICNFAIMQVPLARVSQEKAAYASRNSAPLLKLGNLVLLDSRNLCTERPVKKLDQKSNSPFTIL